MVRREAAHLLSRTVFRSASKKRRKELKAISWSPLSFGSGHLTSNVKYAELLRPIGQMLEGMAVESFVLSVDGDDIVVHGQRREAPAKKTEVTTFRVLWQRVRGQQADPEPATVPTSGVLELRYTGEDIARMDQERREKRAATGGTPEAHSLSQTFRALGDFVDQKQGRLLAIKKEGEALTVEYESALKCKVSEELTVSMLYDYWVRMYLKRRERAEPTG